MYMRGLIGVVLAAVAGLAPAHGLGQGTMVTPGAGSVQAPGTAPVSGQRPPQQPALKPQPDGDQPTFTLGLRANLVDLTFSVTDKKGRFVTGLQLNNFGLLDDGRPPTSVVAFKQLTNLPLRVGIMLDTSSSIRSRFKFEQDSAVDFLLQVLHGDDRAFVEGFDVQTYIPQDYTQNIDLLDQGIRKLRPGGGTALYDALYKTCRDQMLSLKPDVAVRRALILAARAWWTRSRCASARRPSCTPSRPTPARRAARAAMCCRPSPTQPAEGPSFQIGWRMSRWGSGTSRPS
jgi:hypothetical protein